MIINFQEQAYKSQTLATQNGSVMVTHLTQRRGIAQNSLPKDTMEEPFIHPTPAHQYVYFTCRLRKTHGIVCSMK